MPSATRPGSPTLTRSATPRTASSTASSRLKARPTGQRPPVIVDIAGLIVMGGSAWAVFPPADWYITDEQNLPMGLICNTINGRRALCRNAVDRYVPAYRTLDAATAELNGNNRDRLEKVGQFRAASSPAMLAPRITA